jgi:hypothetical protein
VLPIGRTSCSRFWANQFRVLMTAAAYVLMQELRRKVAMALGACTPSTATAHLNTSLIAQNGR